MSSAIVVQVFARYPRPGQVKSRLIPSLGEVAAYELQLAMLDDLFNRLSSCCALELWGTESPTLPHYQHLLAISGGRFQLQQGADLGERMETAVDSAHRNGEIPLLIGADCPQIDCALVAQIDARLNRGAQAVMVPANDGGYVALALQRSHHSLFHDIAWGTATVAEKTRQAMQRCSIEHEVLAECTDIDTAADLPSLDDLPAMENPALQRWLEQYRGLY